VGVRILDIAQTNPDGAGHKCGVRSAKCLTTDGRGFTRMDMDGWGFGRGWGVEGGGPGTLHPDPVPIRSAVAKAMADVWGEGISRRGADRSTRDPLPDSALRNPPRGWGAYAPSRFPSGALAARPKRVARGDSPVVVGLSLPRSPDKTSSSAKRIPRETPIPNSPKFSLLLRHPALRAPHLAISTIDIASARATVASDDNTRDRPVPQTREKDSPVPRRQHPGNHPGRHVGNPRAGQQGSHYSGRIAAISCEKAADGKPLQKAANRGNEAVTKGRARTRTTETPAADWRAKFR
jgi:hypothetical protein